MQPRDLFALAVRIAGLVSLLYMLSFASMFLVTFRLPLPFIFRGILWLLVTVWLLRGAPQLVRFAYPEK